MGVAHTGTAWDVQLQRRLLALRVEGAQLGPVPETAPALALAFSCDGAWA